jgi:hypothetical protein
VRLACLGNGRRRDGPQEIGKMGIWNEKCDTESGVKKEAVKSAKEDGMEQLVR